MPSRLSYTTSKFTVSKSIINYWGSKFIDLSGFATFFEPDTLTKWDVNYIQEFEFLKNSYELANYPEYFVTLVQSQEIITTEYSINSLDVSLAFLGGYTAIAWQLASLLIGAYQTFSYESTLMSLLYTEEKSSSSNGEMANLTDKEEVEVLVTNREPHLYFY